jgi:hypothetical protein
VAFVAVRVLPRANTRRNVCRGFLLFRRVSQAHDIGWLSGSDVFSLDDFCVAQDCMLL